MFTTDRNIILMRRFSSSHPAPSGHQYINYTAELGNRNSGVQSWSQNPTAVNYWWYQTCLSRAEEEVLRSDRQNTLKCRCQTVVAHPLIPAHRKERQAEL